MPTEALLLLERRNQVFIQMTPSIAFLAVAKLRSRPAPILPLLCDNRMREAEILHSRRLKQEDVKPPPWPRR